MQLNARQRERGRGEVRKRGIINAPHSINGVIVAVIVNLNARRHYVERDSSVGRVDQALTFREELSIAR